MLHTLRCIQLQAEYSEKTREYLEKYPNYCRNCSGIGGFHSSYDPSPDGVSLGSGSIQDFDSCPECVENGKCPQCSTALYYGPEDPHDEFSESHAFCALCEWSDQKPSEGLSEYE